MLSICMIGRVKDLPISPPAMSGNKIAPPPDYQFGVSYINFIFNDSKNRIWIGTKYGGVSMYDPKTKKLSFFKSTIIEN